MTTDNIYWLCTLSVPSILYFFVCLSAFRLSVQALSRFKVSPCLKSWVLQRNSPARSEYWKRAQKHPFFIPFSRQFARISYPTILHAFADYTLFPRRWPWNSFPSLPVQFLFFYSILHLHPSTFSLTWSLLQPSSHTLLLSSTIRHNTVILTPYCGYVYKPTSSPCPNRKKSLFPVSIPTSSHPHKAVCSVTTLWRNPIVTIRWMSCEAPRRSPTCRGDTGQGFPWPGYLASSSRRMMAWCWDLPARR